MMWNDGNWGAGTWLVMTSMMLAIWGGLVALIVCFMRYNRPQTPSSRGEVPEVSTRPAEILANRFARGEIDEDEYRRRRDVLGGSPTSS